MADKPGLLSRAYSAISNPLTTAPSRLAKDIADKADKFDPNRSPMKARMMGFGSGALQGLGDVVSSLTSPLSLATTIGTAGSGTALKAGLPQVARGLGMLGRGASALTAAHGGATVLDPRTSMSEKGFGLAELAGGLAGSRVPESSMVPSRTPPPRMRGSVLPDANPPAPMPIVRPRLPDIAKTMAPEPIPARTAPVDFDAMMRQMEGELPSMQVAGEGPTRVNASGESMASQEAMNRMGSMKKAGEQFVVYDRSGNARPLIGPEAVDYRARPGETYGVQTPQGFQMRENRGGKVGR
jgi:hypothetical protein